MEETDPANLGVLFALTFKHEQRALEVASVYWPCEKNTSGALRSRLSEYMKQTNRPGTITNYCRHLVQNVFDRTMEDPLNSCIFGGDWNANWQDSRANPRRSHASIAHWAQEIGLSNAHRPLLKGNNPTRYPSVLDDDSHATTIDHVLTTSTAALVTEAGISHAPIWHGITDHRPLWVAVRLDVPLSLPSQKPSAIPKIRRVELDRKDTFTCEEYRAHLRALVLDQPPGDRRFEDLGEWVENLCASSVNIARSHMKATPKPSRTMRDGWSPTYKTLNIMLNTMIRIRQYLTGQARKAKWPEWYVQTGVRKQITQLLSSAVRELPDLAQRE